MSSSLSFSRTVLMMGVLILGLTACGRRGALEPPPDPKAAEAQASAGASASQGALPSPVGTPRKTTNRPITIPKTPFILDPIL
jgi:predicted small lipoprotein YifL